MADALAPFKSYCVPCMIRLDGHGNAVSDGSGPSWRLGHDGDSPCCVVRLMRIFLQQQRNGQWGSGKHVSIAPSGRTSADPSTAT